MRRAVLALLLLAAPPVGAQQVADTVARPAVPAPGWTPGTGPVVAVDGGHANFHTADGRFAPAAGVLARDGFRVRPTEGAFTRAALEGVDILLIANALHPSTVGNWRQPVAPAFTEAEVELVRSWVEDGGALLLIADHMPFPGAAAALAAAFGFTFRDGFAFGPDRQGSFTFRRGDGSLRMPAGMLAVDSVRSFTGQAFRGPPDAEPVLVLGPDVVSLEPAVAWEFSDATPAVPVGGWWQGAVRSVGKGRVAVFGEAAMFTAQLAGPNRVPMGFNRADAPENARFLLAVARWLAGAGG